MSSARALGLVALLMLIGCGGPTASDGGRDADADASCPMPAIPDVVTINCSPLPAGSTGPCGCPPQHPAAPASLAAPVCDDAGVYYPSRCTTTYPFVYGLYPCEVPICFCSADGWQCPL